MNDPQITKPLASTARLRLYSPRDRLRLQETLAWKQDGTLLELGFGGGGFLSLAGRYFHVLGIDHSSNARRKITPHLRSSMSVRKGEIESEELGREHYDVAAAFNILEHLRQPADTVRKLHAALRESGILIGSVPNNQPGLGWISTMLSNIGDRTHISTFPAEAWRRIFEEAGFQQVRLFGELLFTKYIGVYVRGPVWRKWTYNLMFVCSK